MNGLAGTSTMIEMEYLWNSIHRYEISNKWNISFIESVPFSAYLHFFTFRRWEAERAEHANKVNGKTQIWGP